MGKRNSNPKKTRPKKIEDLTSGHGGTREDDKKLSEEMKFAEKLHGARQEFQGTLLSGGTKIEKTAFRKQAREEEKNFYPSSVVADMNGEGRTC